MFILIEAQWNLKFIMLLLFRTKININRSTVEFKVQFNHSSSVLVDHINRSTVEFKVFLS